MKTLDEVIDYCEGKQTCGEWVGIADALHYLKEYRKHLIQDLDELQDELRQRKHELEAKLMIDELLQRKPWEKRK